LADKLLAQAISKLFIARRDVKAIQHSSGAYTPVETRPSSSEPPIRASWRLQDVLDHLDCTRTFGHYLLDQDSKCKLFAFDIDLEKNNPVTGFHGWLPREPITDIALRGEEPGEGYFEPADAREAWRQRRHPGRPWMKTQFKIIANELMRVINKDLELPCAAAYSGAKGIHVYAFTGHVSAFDAREGAHIVLETLGTFEPSKGSNFYRAKDQNPYTGFPNLTIEVFPKQDSLSGKDLGNLMRLPLGRNLKTNDPTFFINMTTAPSELTPVDPIWALTEGANNPWKRQGE
jgi:hypothetical protein